MRKSIFLKAFCGILTIASIASVIHVTSVVNSAKATERADNSLSYIYDENVNVLEPKGNANVPSYAKWEPKLGIYIREDFYYDKESRRFKEDTKALGSNTQNYAYNKAHRNEKWLKDNKNSSNKLYQAIIKWDKSRGENISLSGIYDIKSDPAFEDNILSLGIEYVPEMLDLAIKDDVWDWPMLAAVECITNVKCLPDGQMLDSSSFKHKEWEDKFKQYMKNGDELVRNNKDIKNMGMFAIPIICSEMKKGNTSYIKYMPSVISDGANTLQSSVGQESISHWEKWIKENNSKITVLKNVIEKYK